jgi:hypothetical protein
MDKIILYSVTVIILIIMVYFLVHRQEPQQGENPIVSTPQTPLGKPAFEWSYSYSSRSDIPWTTVHITARYPDGATTTKQLETIEGGCNEYEKRDADVYPLSQMIICYYAGLGRYYKVVEEGNGYAVKRKTFEEATPDYNPPVQQFETVTTF